MTIQKEILKEVADIQGAIKPSLTFEFLSTNQQVLKYKNAGMWSWDYCFRTDDYDAILAQGLDGRPIGLLFFGFRMKGKPALITVFKRFHQESQKEVPILTPNGDIRDLSTVLTLQSLADVTLGTPTIELGDAYLRGYPQNLGLNTPFRHDSSILNKYLNLVHVIHTSYPHDYLMALPMGVLPWSQNTEDYIIGDIRQTGGKLTVQEYLDRYNQGEHYLPNAPSRIGQIRGLSKISERLITRTNLQFRTVGYSPCDFGWVSLSDPIE